jgi:multiple sugar transport system permease protein
MKNSPNTHALSGASTVSRTKIDVWRYVSIGLLLIGCIPMIVPLLWMAVTSVKPGATAFDLPPTWIPKELHFENYSALFQSDVPVGAFLWNSIFISGAVTVAQLITSSMAGYAFAHLSFKGSKSLFLLMLTSLMMPLQVTIIPMYLIMSSLNLVDTHWAIILPFSTSAFGVFLLRQFFMTLPRELLEAARIDGASHWVTFFQIALPLARPMLATLGIITFTNTWNNYFLPLVFLNSWEKMTLPLGIFSLSNVYGSGNVATIMAGVALAILPVLIVFLVAQRQIIAGLTSGAVKG